MTIPAPWGAIYLLGRRTALCILWLFPRHGEDLPAWAATAKGAP